MTFIQKIKDYFNPKICKRHHKKLQVHGWRNEKFCKFCFKKTGRYTYK